jgi:hypothetical protein
MIGATLLGWVMLALIQIMAAEAGYRLHNWARARRKENPDDEDEGPATCSAPRLVCSAC